MRIIGECLTAAGTGHIPKTDASAFLDSFYQVCMYRVENHELGAILLIHNLKPKNIIDTNILGILAKSK